MEAVLPTTDSRLTRLKASAVMLFKPHTWNSWLLRDARLEFFDVGLEKAAHWIDTASIAWPL